MAWNTGVSYLPSDFFTASMLNGVGNDLRTWGGNVNAAGYSLTGLLGCYTTILDITGYITTHPLSTTPPIPGTSAESREYQKGSKWVVQYNDAGTARYKSLDLAGTGVTWVHSTTAP